MNLESLIMLQDRNSIDSDIQGIFLFSIREDALNWFSALKNKWSQKNPRCKKKNLSVLLKYCGYPKPIRRSIHSTNL